MIRKLLIILLSGGICLLGTTFTLAMNYNESPMLKTKVAAGLLPAIEKRLPKEPFVVGPGVLLPEDELDFETGEYGGTLRMIGFAPDRASVDVFIINDEPLIMGPGLTGEDIRGNVLESFEISEDQKVFTFYMREGLKWSDGVPVTIDDVLFAYEDVLLNKELTPTFPRWMKTGNRADGEPMKLEIIDDYTFRISFAEPYGAFPVQLAICGWRGYTDLLKPKYYLKQFHPRYTPLEKLKLLTKTKGFGEDEWWNLFELKDITNWDVTKSEAVGFPTLNSWMLVGATTQVYTYERNPYYFKVDKSGNQLPYIDKLRSELVADIEMITMKVIAGEVDLAYGQVALEKVPILKENEKKGDYRVVILDSHTWPTTIYLNLTYEDPVWRKVVRDVRFRKALNMGINREEIIDNLWLGFGASPSKSIPSVYDPAKANQLLDEMGLDKRDTEGWRLGPDGKTFVIPFEISRRSSEMVPTTELVAEHFKALGVKTTIKTIDSSLRVQRNNANQLKATVERNTGPLWWQRATANWYKPDTWGPLWDLWFATNGKEGEEPPTEVKRFVDLLYESMTASLERRQEIIDEYERLWYDNIFCIIPVEEEKRPVQVAKNLGNVAHGGYSIGAVFAGKQFFFKQ